MKLKIIFILIIVSITMIYGQTKFEKTTYEKYIKQNVASKAELDVFLSNKGTWAQFSPELGYILGNSMPHDGHSKNFTISTVQKNGARTQVNYKDKPCRINVYGNSFAQCHQASDGETWEEMLAASFGEPIRNYGMGGYGAYQSYRRMLKEEATKYKAKNIVFYVWGDDHQRSLLQTRYMAIKPWNDKMDPGFSLHGNFWPYMDFDLKTGEFTEHDNKLNTPKLLYKMTDPEWMYENLKDNLALQALNYVQGYTSDFDTLKMVQLAKWLKVDFDVNDTKNMSLQVEKLLDTFGYAANLYILDKVKAYAKANDKNLLVVIFDPFKVTRQLMFNVPRADQVMVDYLKKEKFNFFDMNVVHYEDFKKTRATPEEYFAKYFTGHYDPIGNMFFATSIKSTMVEWLNPRPITFQKSDKQYINFKDYLQGLK